MRKVYRQNYFDSLWDILVEKYYLLEYRNSVYNPVFLRHIEMTHLNAVTRLWQMAQEKKNRSAQTLIHHPD